MSFQPTLQLTRLTAFPLLCCNKYNLAQYGRVWPQDGRAKLWHAKLRPELQQNTIQPRIADLGRKMAGQNQVMLHCDVATKYNLAQYCRVWPQDGRAKLCHATLRPELQQNTIQPGIADLGRKMAEQNLLLNSIFSTFYYRPRTIGSAATKITIILKIRFFNDKKHRKGKDIVQERVGQQ